jgi:hypothetical protein
MQGGTSGARPRETPLLRLVRTVRPPLSKGILADAYPGRGLTEAGMRVYRKGGLPPGAAHRVAASHDLDAGITERRQAFK